MPLVILVDDEEDFLEIASLKLQGSGFETFATSNSHEAISKAAERRPDLFLSDIYMPPGPNGWEVALELKHNPKTHDVRLAFFTSLGDPWAEVPFTERPKIRAELGEVVILSKTKDVERLGERVMQLISL